MTVKKYDWRTEIERILMQNGSGMPREELETQLARDCEITLDEARRYVTLHTGTYNNFVLSEAGFVQLRLAA